MALPPHIPIAIKLFPHLVACAKEGRRTTYEEMGAVVGLETRMFSRPLAFIRDFVCAEHNLPPIAVIVERKGSSTRSSRMNPDVFGNMTAAEYSVEEERMLKEVYAYEKWDQANNGLQAMFTF